MNNEKVSFPKEWDETKIMVAILAKNMEDLVTHIKIDTVKVDLYDSETGATGLITLTNRWKRPFVIESFTYFANVGAANLTGNFIFGDRTIPVRVPSADTPIINVTGLNWQMQPRDTISFQQATNLGPSYFSVCGYSSYRKIEE